LVILFCFCLSFAQGKDKKEEEDPIIYLLVIASRQGDLQKLISKSTMTEDDKKTAIELLEIISTNTDALYNCYEKKLNSSELNVKILSEMLISYASSRSERKYPDLDELKRENEKLENLLWELRIMKSDLELAKPSPMDFEIAWQMFKPSMYQDLWFDLWYSKTFPSKYSRKAPFPNYLWLYLLLKEKK